MSSEKTISNARNAFKKALACVSAAAIILTTFDANQAKAQNETDTIYGTGILLTKDNETGNKVPNTTLTLTPNNMGMITPDTTYEFITNSNGIAYFENPGLPVYIDSTTDIENIIASKSKVLPNFGSEINAFFPEIQKGVIELYNMAGQLVKKKEFHSDKEYVPLNDLKEGMYVYNLRTTDGIELGGKFLKQNSPLQGPASRPTEQSSSFKDSKFYEATYWAKWEHPDFFTDSTLVTLHEGYNEPLFFYMNSNIPPPIDNIDLEGHVWKLENTSSALENAQVHVRVIGSAQEFTTTSDENGYFRIDNVPLDETIRFSVGGLSDRYSFTGIEYTTPSEIIDSDSVNSNFSAVLPLKISSSSAAHIDNMTASGTNQDTIWYYFGNSLSVTQKNTMRNYFTQLEADEDNVYVFAEKFEESNIGINIEFGTYNTNPS